MGAADDGRVVSIFTLYLVFSLVLILGRFPFWFVFVVLAGSRELRKRAECWNILSRQVAFGPCVCRCISVSLRFHYSYYKLQHLVSSASKTS
jgi:hypothetical protein